MDEIEELIRSFNSCDLTTYTGTRRGLCGEINVNTFFKKLISDRLVECLLITDSTREQTIDIYKYHDKELYFKRVCICDKPCSILSTCSRVKNKMACDGHHIVIVSNSSSVIIDESNDYVIDFTYKQMLFSRDNEDSHSDFITKLPGYLFLPFNEFINYPINISNFTQENINRWQANITNPCKFIISFTNSNICLTPESVDRELYHRKYLQYKNKYLKLKKNLTCKTHIN